MHKEILTSENLFEIAGRINTFIGDRIINVVSLRTEKPLEEIDFNTAHKTTYAQLIIEPDRDKFLVRKAIGHHFDNSVDTGLLAQIGDTISFLETDVICLHNGQPIPIPRRMTVLRFANMPSPSPESIIGNRPKIISCLD